MKNILFIISLISFLSANNDKIHYHVFELFEKPEYNENYELNDDSLRYLNNEVYSMLRNGAEVEEIYDYLKRKTQIFGIAVYTYKENGQIFVETISFQFSEKKKSLSDLNLYYRVPIVFTNNIKYTKLSEKKKVEYIFKLPANGSKYTYHYNKSKDRHKRLGFPIPVPDAK